MRNQKKRICISVALVLAVVSAGTAVALGSQDMFAWWKPPRFRADEQTVIAEPHEQPDSSTQREESHQPSASSEEESSVPENSAASPSEAESFPEGPGVDPNTRPEKWDVDIEEAREITGKSLVAADPADEEFLAYTLYVLVADLEDDTTAVLPCLLEYRYRQGEITIDVSEDSILGWGNLGPMQPQSYAGQQINVNDRYVDPEGREMRSYMMRTKMGHPMTAVFSREIPAEEVFERMLSLQDV